MKNHSLCAWDSNPQLHKLKVEMNPLEQWQTPNLITNC